MNRDKHTIRKQEERIRAYERELTAVRNSLSFKLGWAFTSPFRFIYDFLTQLGIHPWFRKKEVIPYKLRHKLKDLSLSEQDRTDFHLIVPDLDEDKKIEKTALVYLPFFAVGGAEHLLLNVIKCLPTVRWVLVSTVSSPSSLGNMAQAFRKITPHVFEVADLLEPHRHALFVEFLFQQFNPGICYVSNGSAFIYDILPLLKNRHPEIRFVNQVYDYQAGWIQRYVADHHMVMDFDLHIGANPLICQAYAQKGIPLTQIELIEHCIDTHVFSPDLYSSVWKHQLKQQFGLPLDKTIIAFIGRLHPQKRPLDFVELARRMEKREDLYFFMVGNGEMEEVVEQQLEDIHLSNFCRRGFYKPASDILAVIDILVLPSAYEGMPLVIMEAQAMGKAVVATDVGNNQEFLSYTGGGVVVPNIGEVGSLIAAIDKLLQEPINATEVREKVVKRVDAKIIAQQYDQAFFGREIC